MYELDDVTSTPTHCVVIFKMPNVFSPYILLRCTPTSNVSRATVNTYSLSMTFIISFFILLPVKNVIS